MNNNNNNNNNNNKSSIHQTLYKRRLFMMNCLCKNDPSFKEYYEKLEDDNKKFEKKENKLIEKLVKQMKDKYDKEVKKIGMDNIDKKEELGVKLAIEYKSKFEKIAYDKIEWGLKSNEKLIKSPKYKSALKKANRVCNNRIINYRDELEKNLDLFFKVLEMYKEKNQNKNSAIEKHYTSIVKLINILQKEIKLLKIVY